MADRIIKVCWECGELGPHYMRKPTRCVACERARSRAAYKNRPRDVPPRRASTSFTLEEVRLLNKLLLSVSVNKELRPLVRHEGFSTLFNKVKSMLKKVTVAEHG